MKILRPFTGTGAVFFPVGLPPQGTCGFATESCSDMCYAIDPIDANFDEEVRISQEEKWTIYDYVMTAKKRTLVDRFLHELDGLQTPIFHWFGSGDCLPKDTERISELINLFRHNKVTQMGFTRNKKLWKEHKDVFALTIEEVVDATDEDALYSIPNYEAQVSVMYSPRYQVKGGFCGPITCKDINGKLEHYINCRTCLRLKTGCFDRR
jgi:hypothetical protein